MAKLKIKRMIQKYISVGLVLAMAVCDISKCP